MVEKTERDEGTEDWRRWNSFNWKEKEAGRGKEMMIGRRRDEKEMLGKERKILSHPLDVKSNVKNDVQCRFLAPARYLGFIRILNLVCR
jgi:hypothetical protein